MFLYSENPYCCEGRSQVSLHRLHDRSVRASCVGLVILLPLVDRLRCERSRKEGSSSLRWWRQSHWELRDRPCDADRLVFGSWVRGTVLEGTGFLGVKDVVDWPMAYFLRIALLQLPRLLLSFYYRYETREAVLEHALQSTALNQLLVL